MAGIVTRFAPSPTGYLHVGGARTALFNWLLSRHTGGQFLLRIEDTDLARSTEASVTGLIDDLHWLGLNWDNAQLVYQSKRVEIYNQIINDLISRGMAYKAYETPQELDAQRKIAEKSRRPFVYKRPNLTDQQIRDFESSGRPSVVRFVMPVQEYRFSDAVLGKEIVLGADQIQDFVIRKTDGMPTYHFAVVVDDEEMKITHILRGQEHLLNTVNHIALQAALGYSRPIYGHLPVILNTDGSKMGKRDRDKKVRHQANMWLRNTKKTAADLASLTGLPEERINQWLAEDSRQLDGAEQKLLMPVIGLSEYDLPEILVHDFRANGYLPEVLLNFLALLGWSPGSDKERMSIAEMVELFTIERIGQSNAKFNREKLLAFNTEALAAAGATKLQPAFADFLAANPSSPINRASETDRQSVLEMNSGMRTLREAEQKSAFLFIPDESIVPQTEAIQKFLLKNDGEGLKALRAARDILSGASDWSAHTLETAIKAHCDATGLGLGKIAQPIRVAISGTAVSPPIFQSLVLLGRQRTLARIDRCLQMVVKSEV